MESHLSEESLWAGALAARLRVLQANFADDTPDTRREFIAQEIEQALKGSVPEKRRRLLAALADRFPGWQDAAPAHEPGAGGHAAAAPESPEELLERLVAALPSFTPAQREALAQRLNAAGLIVGGSETTFELSPELQKRLGIESRPVAAARAAKSFTIVLDTVLALDQLAWTLWKQVAAKSVVRKEADLARLSGEYLAGSQDVSTTQVTQTAERTRKLIASLLGALGKAGTTFARERARLFEPEAIEADARAEKKWNESVEFACWRKYVQLCHEYGTEGAIEKTLQEAIVKAAENLLLGRPVS